MGCQNSKNNQNKRLIDEKQNLNILDIKQKDGHYEKQFVQSHVIQEKLISSIENIYYYYNFRKQLGKGAFGSVWECEHKIDHTLVAVKIISKKLINYTTPLIIQRELSIFKHMDHPNICKFLETYTDKDYIYIVTEILQGGTLLQKLNEHSKFSETQIANYIKQILWALSYLHGQGVVHRDLKMENIVFQSKSPNSILKIIDFGIAKKLEFENKKEIQSQFQDKNSNQDINQNQNQNNQEKQNYKKSTFQKQFTQKQQNQIEEENSSQEEKIDYKQINSNKNNNNNHNNNNQAQISSQNSNNYSNQLSSIQSGSMPLIQQNKRFSYQKQNTPQVGTHFYMAPEVIFNEQYDIRCDIWSLGIILYALISGGNYPFYDEEDLEDGYINMQDNSWKYVSNEVKDLITQMLQIDPQKRISVAEALKHKWFDKLKNQRLSSVEIPPSIAKKRANYLQRIQKFSGYTGFKKLALELVVRRLNYEQIDPEIQNLFQLLDNEKKGVVTAKSLKQQIHKFTDQNGQKVSIKEVNQIITKLNLTQSNHELKKFTTNRESVQFDHIKLQLNNQKKQNDLNQVALNYTDFLAATLDPEIYLQQKVMDQIFKYFDVRQLGYIEIQDIVSVLAREGRQLPAKSVKAIYREMIQYCVDEPQVSKKQPENNQDNQKQLISELNVDSGYINNIPIEQYIFGFNSFCNIMGFNNAVEKIDLEIQQNIKLQQKEQLHQSQENLQIQLENQQNNQNNKQSINLDFTSPSKYIECPSTKKQITDTKHIHDHINLLEQEEISKEVQLKKSSLNDLYKNSINTNNQSQENMVILPIINEEDKVPNFNNITIQEIGNNYKKHKLSTLEIKTGDIDEIYLD